MKNIIWQQPNGLLAVYGLSEGDSQAMAVLLHDEGLVDADWVAVAFDIAEFPLVPQDLWRWQGGVITSIEPPPPTAEELRTSAIDTVIANDTTVGSIRVMTNAEYDTWWSTNVTNAAQAIAVLKRAVRILVRRLTPPP
jgi:hypothetical protein